MPSFRTEIKLPASNWQIEHCHQILMTGSCFTDNIGQKLSNHFFKTCLNPFGIVFNPISVVNQLQMLLSKQLFTEKDLFNHYGLWHSWQHHSHFSGEDKSDVLQSINEFLQKGRELLWQADYLIITLGSAYAYQLKSTGEVVSNCHQYPNKNFNKKLLSVNEIVDGFDQIFKELKKQNSKLKTIFTISPVRHWKDGVVENQQSKSTLILAVHQLIKQLDDAAYFPSYELVMDDLRDYRFYKADLLHPNKAAVDYIWQKFKNAYFNTKTQSLVERIEKLNKSKTHRPRFPKSEQHLAFLAQLKIEEELLKAEIENQ